MKRLVAGCVMAGMVAVGAAPVLAMEGKGPSTTLSSKKEAKPGTSSPKGNVTVTSSKKVAHAEAPADRSLLNAAPGTPSAAPAKVGC